MKIVIYTSPTCHYCEDVKSLLNKKGVDYDVINVVDILKDESKTEKFLELTGGLRSVPVTVINDEVVMGYNEEEIIRLITINKNEDKQSKAKKQE